MFACCVFLLDPTHYNRTTVVLSGGVGVAGIVPSEGMQHNMCGSRYLLCRSGHISSFQRCKGRQDCIVIIVFRKRNAIQLELPVWNLV